MDKNKVIQAATRYVQKGQLDRAISEYGKILREDPKDVRVLLKVGELQQKSGDVISATKTLRQVAEAYSTDGFFLKAVAVYKQVLKLDASLIDVNLKLAELYQQLGLLQDALAQYQQVAARHERAGRLREAIDALRRMVSLDPENLACRVNLADLYAKDGRTSEAMLEFRRAADALKAQGRPADFLRIGERIVALDPNDLPLAREMATLYLARGDSIRALARLQPCFGADPKNAETLELLGRAFLDLGQQSKAASVYKELAGVHADAGRVDEAREAWKRVLRASPEDADARAALEPSPSPVAAHTASLPAGESPRAAVERLIAETDVYVKYGLRQKALDHLHQVLDLDPDCVEAHERMAALRASGGEQEAAWASLATACRICADQGWIDRGRIHYERLREEAPQLPELAPLSHVYEGSGSEAGQGWVGLVPAGAPERPDDDVALIAAALDLAGAEQIADDAEVLLPGEDGIAGRDAGGGVAHWPIEHEHEDLGPNVVDDWDAPAHPSPGVGIGEEVSPLSGGLGVPGGQEAWPRDDVGRVGMDQFDTVAQLLDLDGSEVVDLEHVAAPSPVSREIAAGSEGWIGTPDRGDDEELFARNPVGLGSPADPAGTLPRFEEDSPFATAHDEVTRIYEGAFPATAYDEVTAIHTDAFPAKVPGDAASLDTGSDAFPEVEEDVILDAGLEARPAIEKDEIYVDRAIPVPSRKEEILGVEKDDSLHAGLDAPAAQGEDALFGVGGDQLRLASDDALFGAGGDQLHPEGDDALFGTGGGQVRLASDEGLFGAGGDQLHPESDDALFGAGGDQLRLASDDGLFEAGGDQLHPEGDDALFGTGGDELLPVADDAPLETGGDQPRPAIDDALFGTGGDELLPAVDDALFGAGGDQLRPAGGEEALFGTGGEELLPAEEEALPWVGDDSLLEGEELLEIGEDELLDVEADALLAVEDEAAFDLPEDAILGELTESELSDLPGSAPTGAWTAAASASSPDALRLDPEEHADIETELDEASFFLAQGLLSEAEDICRSILRRVPDDPTALEILREVASRGEALTQRPGAPAGSTGAERASPSVANLFEVLENVEDPKAAFPDEIPYTLEDVFAAFKKGLAQTLRPEDVQTHYDIGIAYHEMGLLTDAIEQFSTALAGFRGEPREIDCLSMIARCKSALGAHDEAIARLVEALELPAAVGSARQALLFELGTSHEARGDFSDALACFVEVEQEDPSFRGVGRVIARLHGRIGGARKNPVA